MSGDTLVVGSHQEDGCGTNCGAAYVFDSCPSGSFYSVSGSCDDCPVGTFNPPTWVFLAI